MKKQPIQYILMSACLAVSALPITAYSQGALTPPGAPAPTMKTLQQIEPRRAIGGLPFSITNAGSYYVTTNLTGVTGQNGITISVDDVTLDLGGFILAGVSGSLDGIHISNNLARIAVGHGVVNGWGGQGIDADQCEGCVFERLRISGSGSWGLVAGLRSAVRDCTVINNPGGGINADYHSVVSDCVSTGNGGNGFWCSAGGTVRDCLAMNNIGDGIAAGDVSVLTACTSRDNAGSGFSIGASSLVNGCAATANGQSGILVGHTSVVKDCSVVSSGYGGILANDGSTISGCSVGYVSGAAGIQVQTGCTVRDNTCTFMRDEDTPAILAKATGSRIEGNSVCSNYWGIVIQGTGNFIFRNTAAANSSGNYTNAPGNVAGQIVNVSGGANVTNANPWTNFSY